MSDTPTGRLKKKLKRRLLIVEQLTLKVKSLEAFHKFVKDSYPEVMADYKTVEQTRHRIGVEQ